MLPLELVDDVRSESDLADPLGHERNLSGEAATTGQRAVSRRRKTTSTSTCGFVLRLQMGSRPRVPNSRSPCSLTPSVRLIAPVNVLPTSVVRT
jgi:hypothetical protein